MPNTPLQRARRSDQQLGAIASMTKLIGLVAGLAVFALWMSVVGNPHVVETIIGIVLALVVWFFVTHTLRRIFAPRPADQRAGSTPPAAEVAGIAKCPKCAWRSTVPLGRLIEVTCPSCGHKYEYGP